MKPEVQVFECLEEEEKGGKSGREREEAGVKICDCLHTCSVFTGRYLVSSAAVLRMIHLYMYKCREHLVEQ